MYDLIAQWPTVKTWIAVRANILSSVGRILKAALESSTDTQVLVVTDDTVGDLYGATVVESVQNAGFRVAELRIPPGEASKSLGQAERLYGALADRRADRESVVLSLGGGVVSDLAGFVAATWMRGVRFAILPTTMEAAIDASIGGKTAVNLAAGKNLVGAFHQPLMVAIDPNCLTTLDRRDIRAGIAEAVKHALIRSDDFFAWQESHADEITTLDPAITTEFILRNLRIKVAIVEKDAQERSGLRMLLNLGHTIGHAIESRASYALRHGECVALGTVAVCRLSQELGLLPVSDVERVEGLIARLGLPQKMPTWIGTDEIIETMRGDKKASAGRMRFVLLEGIGRPVIRDDVDEKLVRAAYESLRP